MQGSVPPVNQFDDEPSKPSAPTSIPTPTFTSPLPTSASFQPHSRYKSPCFVRFSEHPLRQITRRPAVHYQTSSNFDITTTDNMRAAVLVFAVAGLAAADNAGNFNRDTVPEGYSSAPAGVVSQISDGT